MIKSLVIGFLAFIALILGAHNAQPAHTPPAIHIDGDNPAIIDVGASYRDLGATTSPEGDLNLGIEASVDGGATTTVDQITIDTSQPGTHTILYCATEPSGFAACATRTVTIVAIPGQALFTASPDAGTNPLTVTVRFPQSLGNTIDFVGDASDPFNVDNQYCVNDICKVSHTFPLAGNYTVDLYRLEQACTTTDCFEGSTPIATTQIIVTSLSTNHPSVNFSPRGITVPPSEFGINHVKFSGSASGTSELDIFIVPVEYQGPTDFNSLASLPATVGAASGVIPVAVGQWSTLFSGGLAGSYSIFIFDYSHCTDPTSCNIAPLLYSAPVTISGQP